MAELDDQIAAAIAQLSGADRPPQPDAYIESFRESARGKARDVLERLNSDPPPNSGPRPVFVSVGGGDATELAYLLENSEATDGILLESHRASAELARQLRISGKELHVFEGDAQERLREVMEFASSFVASKRADFQVVTCHAVIHELYDRSQSRFDSARFFGTIFGDPTIPTWFTYREPGVPEKWPGEVLLQARCRPQSLLDLAWIIRRRHRSFELTRQEPHVLGDHVRMDRGLAMETLVKLFYLSGLPYELEERSTSVDHQRLESTLMMAVGHAAARERRASVWSTSAPTGSFMDRWRDLGVTASGYEDDREIRLSLPESQTRVIAWRVPEMPQPIKDLALVGRGLDVELGLAAEAHAGKDHELLLPLLVSKGRAWIESPNSTEALELLAKIRAESGANELLWLWCHYLISIADLFAGRLRNEDAFSPALEARAQAVGLDLLYRAERMECLRKFQRFDQAVSIANSLLPLLDDIRLTPSSSSLERYTKGTSAFVLNNFLRSGGAYRLAWRAVNVAAAAFNVGSESHGVELAHCHYARNVCVAMTGVASFETDYPGHPHRRRFAAALIQLAYSHASLVSGRRRAGAKVRRRCGERL